MLLLYLLLFFHSSLPVFCQHGVNSGLCSCQPLLIPPNKSKLAWYSFQLEDYDTCPNNIIRFKLRRTTVCGIAFEDWVQKLKACFIAKNFTECRIKVPKTNMDMKILSTSVTTTNQDRSIARSSMQDIHENQTDLLLDLPDTTNATFFIQNQETDLTVQGSVDKNFKGLAHIPVTAAAPPEEENIKKMTVTIILLLELSLFCLESHVSDLPEKNRCTGMFQNEILLCQPIGRLHTLRELYGDKITELTDDIPKSSKDSSLQLSGHQQTDSSLYHSS